MENTCKVLLGKYSRRGPLLYDRRKKLGMDLKKQGVRQWIAFSWLSMRPNGYKADADADGVVK
jgi:hypothetical protein